MRKAAAIVCILLGGLCQSAFAKGTAARDGHSGFAIVDQQMRAGFTLAQTGEKVLPISDAALDRQAFGEAAAATIVPVIAASIVRKDTAGLVTISFFLGRGNGDIFSSLYELHAWRAKFKNLLMGAGIYRDIPISKAIRIQPYMGFIRSHALLRPSDFSGNRESFEYRLTAFCIGLPLVCGF